jgi:hypothetical protein
MNERVRGTGGLPTSFRRGEPAEPADRPLRRREHRGPRVLPHDRQHADPDRSDLADRRDAAYHNAIEKGLYHDTYTAINAAEYWAEIAQAYFDCNRVNNWNHGPIGRREQLKAYDPVGYELCPHDVQSEPRAGLAISVAAGAAERHRAAGSVRHRSLLHQVHLGPRVPGDRAAGQRSRPCSTPTRRSGGCSPTATTSSRPSSPTVSSWSSWAETSGSRPAGVQEAGRWHGHARGFRIRAWKPVPQPRCPGPLSDVQPRDEAAGCRRRKRLGRPAGHVRGRQPGHPRFCRRDPSGDGHPAG